MTAIPKKITIDAATRKSEREFMREMGKMREKLAREVEESLLDALELHLGCPVSTKTEPRYKFTDCDGESVFTLIAFEAKIDA